MEERRRDNRLVYNEIVSLRDYFEETLRQRDARLADYKAAIDRALQLFTSNLEIRLANLNELRGNVIVREEFMGEMKALRLEIRGLSDRMDRIDGWRNRIIGVQIALTLTSGALGAWLGHFLFK